MKLIDSPAFIAWVNHFAACFTCKAGEYCDAGKKLVRMANEKRTPRVKSALERER